MRILTGQGIGDAVWTLFKAQGIAEQYGDGAVDIRTLVSSAAVGEARAVEFLRRFDFVRSSATTLVPPAYDAAGPSLQPGAITDDTGRYRYWPDGLTAKRPLRRFEIYDIDFVAIPNQALERGVRLEQWLPEVPINWEIFRHYRHDQSEVAVAKDLRDRTGPYVVFFMGSEAGSGFETGHNRLARWTPQEWAELGEQLQTRYNVAIVVVGADEDRSYYEQQVLPLLPDGTAWTNCVGNWPSACQTLEVCQRAAAIVSYQSGIGICSHYFGVPTAIFWRAEGDSISANTYLSFDERMAHAWAYPDWQESGKLFPAIYTKHGVADILTWADQWL